MTIAFNSIPVDLRTPGVFGEIEPGGAIGAVPARPHSILITGQQGPTATATEGEIYLVQGDQDALFQRKSVLARMCAAARRQHPTAEIYACPLDDDGSAVKAAGSIDFTGTTTERGTVVIYAAGRRIVVPVPSGTAAAAVPALCVTEAAKATDCPIVFTDGTGGSLVGTAYNGGTIGNGLKMGVCLGELERLPAGLTAPVTQLASGAVDPDFDTVVTSMAEDQYLTVATGLATKTETDKIDAELVSRWGPLRAIEGVQFVATAGSQGTLSTYGNALNSHLQVAVGVEVSGMTLPPEEIAAQTAAESARQDNLDRARPFDGLPLVSAYAPHRTARFRRDQRNVLLYDGISTTKPTTDGRMSLERLITTYQTNGQGVADPSYLDLTTVRILSFLRYSVRIWIALRFPRHKLMTSGEAPPTGQPIATPELIRNSLIDLWDTWFAAGMVEGREAFIEQLQIIPDAGDPNRVNAVIPPDTINQFAVFAHRLNFTV